MFDRAIGRFAVSYADQNERDAKRLSSPALGVGNARAVPASQGQAKPPRKTALHGPGLWPGPSFGRDLRSVGCDATIDVRLHASSYAPPYLDRFSDDRPE